MPYQPKKIKSQIWNVAPKILSYEKCQILNSDDTPAYTCQMTQVFFIRIDDDTFAGNAQK